MTELPDLSQLTYEEKDALIRALWAQVQALTVRVAELEARLGAPPKTPDNSSLPSGVSKTWGSLLPLSGISQADQSKVGK